MVGGGMKNLSLIELYNDPTVNHLSGFTEVAQNLNIMVLAEKYRNLVENAPQRHDTGKQHFVGHDYFREREGSNRKEEHLAGALFNYCRAGNSLKLPDGKELQILDYQFPLQAKRSDKDVGKVDLFGVMDHTVPCVIELKVDQKRGGRPDTPLKALLEGLAYCAIIEANQEAIRKEAHSKLSLHLQSQGLYLIVLAPEKYWNYFINNKSTGPWQGAMQQLASKISKTLGPTVSLISIRDFSLEMAGSQKSKPSIQLNYLF
jgi:hypothetical protein